MCLQDNLLNAFLNLSRTQHRNHREITALKLTDFLILFFVFLLYVTSVFVMNIVERKYP